MLKIAYQIAPDAGDEINVMRLARQEREPRKDAENSQVSLCAKKGIGGMELCLIMLASVDVVGKHFLFDCGGDIASSILQQ